MKNCIVAQSGGPTAVINASLAGVIRGVIASQEIDKIYGAVHGIEGVVNDDLIDLSSIFYKDSRINRLVHTPASYLGTCRHRLPLEDDNAEVYEKIYKTFDKHNIGYFFYIGGNDSMDTVDKLNKYAQKIGSDIKFIGVPKTIDNDLAVTDHTPGFGSAAKYIATSMREIVLDSQVYDIPTLTIVEIMGRNAGWLTAASALARSERHKICAPHYIYLPEVAMDVDKFVDDMVKAVKKHRNVVVAVSEGVKDKDGRYICEGGTPGETDAFGHTQLTGTAQALAHEVRKKMDIKIRAIEFSLLQRSSAHIASLTDVNEAIEIGEFAVSAAIDGATGVMIIVKRLSTNPYIVELCTFNVAEIANVERKVPLEWITKDGNDVTNDVVEYIRPLLEGESYPRFKHGVPHYITRHASNT
ncbi:MAG: 6-phosphofructokinase [Clostridiales bacterium]|jgi:6-phosphofructokinase 1|nr:6-phosphofructokinase [Clostridiales bacterium]